MRSNTAARNTRKTYEGAQAAPLDKAPRQLERQVATCMLFENTFYEKGNKIAEQITEAAKRCTPEEIALMARKARNEFKLRHVPLYLLAVLDKLKHERNWRFDVGSSYLREAIPQVVQRPDEIPELISIASKLNKKAPKRVLSAQMKKGLAEAFQKFNGYQLAKWNRDSEIKLRDALFLVHAKPKDELQAKLWKSLVDGTLEAPDTWEVALSAGKDKKATWERLLEEKKLGFMALLMNLRNMEQANVNRGLVRQALLDGAFQSKALPFRFITAARHAKSYEDTLSRAMTEACKGMERLPGTTYVMIDHSGSMGATISKKSEVTRFQTAAALAVLISEIADDARFFTFSYGFEEVGNAHGIALMGKLERSMIWGGTQLFESTAKLLRVRPKADRYIVITDEQAHPSSWGRVGKLPALNGAKGYVINVAPYQYGVELDKGWTRINGWSERVVDFIRWSESELDSVTL